MPASTDALATITQFTSASAAAVPMVATADRFGVTEDFIRKAVCLYVHGNLATELYF